MRFRIDFAYDGTDFKGWAAQPGLRTVEEELTRAVETVTRCRDLRLTVAGRTDAGVHARGAVCHVDLPDDAVRLLPGRSDREPAVALTTRLRGVLPSDVAVNSVSAVPDEFDARFSALRRRYSYRLADASSAWDPLRRRDTVRSRRTLDVAAMNVAAAELIGLHDFAAFCKKREGATTTRTLLDYAWARDADGTLIGTVQADAFCHSMVRALVGAVVPVGEGRREVSWPRRVMATAERDPGVVVMPAHGLCLEEVAYPPAELFGVRSAQARARRDSLSDPAVESEAR